MIRALLLACLIGMAGFAAQARTMELYDTALLRLLDKGTARVEQVELPVGKPIVFGRLQIDLRSCQQSPPEEEPESAAFMVVSEIKPGAAEAILFRGWMFASNPSLSALEHPLYDVWVVSCKNAKVKPSNALPTLSLPAPAGVVKDPPDSSEKKPH